MPSVANEKMNEEQEKKLAETRMLMEKPWDECTDEERVKKLRMELLNQRYLVNRIMRLERNINKLKNHQHLDGKIVTVLTEEYSGEIGEASAFDLLK